MTTENMSSSSAEECLLSCLLMDGVDVLMTARRLGLTSEMFFKPEHQEVFISVCDLADRGIIVGLDTVAEDLKAKRKFESLGGYPLLLKVSKATSTILQSSYFAERVIMLWKIRTAAQAGSALAEIMRVNDHTEDAFLEVMLPHLTKLSGLVVKEGGESLLQVIERVSVDFDIMATGKLPPGEYIYLGIPAIDAVLGPLNVRTDKYVCIAARPSVGKTSLATQIMQSVLAKEKESVVLDFQLENGRDNHVRQMAARHAQLDLKKPDTWTPDQQTKFKDYIEGMKRVQDKRLFIYDDDDTIEKITRRARWVKAKTGKITLMVVDYLQLVGTEQRGYEKPREIVNYASAGLKALAKELDTVILVLSQLSRKHEDEERNPEMRDLMESGKIEADADVVLMLGVPKGSEMGDDGCIATDLFRRKNKYGQVGAVQLVHKRTTTTFFGRKPEQTTL